MDLRAGGFPAVGGFLVRRPLTGARRSSLFITFPLGSAIADSSTANSACPPSPRTACPASSVPEDSLMSSWSNEVTGSAS